MASIRKGVSKLAQKLLNLWAESGANIIDDDTSSVLELENSGLGSALSLKTLIGSPTVAPLILQTSTVSGAAIEFRGKAFVSATSGGSITGAFRIKVGNLYYWVPTMVAVAGQGA